MLGSPGGRYRLQDRFVVVGTEKDLPRFFKGQDCFYLTEGRHIPNGLRLLGRERSAAHPVIQSAADIPPPQREGILIRAATRISRSRRYADSYPCCLSDR